MFRRLLPHCRAALPGAAAVLAVPAVARPPALPVQERITGTASAPRARRVVACEEAGAAACARALRAPAAGDADAFHAAYELGEELGRGTFGVVQRAVHKPTGQLRAVKRVHRLEASTALAEADALASLDHPNVVGFHECFQADGEVVLVQELCEGVPLEAKLTSVLGRGLRSQDAAVILRQMLVAVQHCHERGFVHRDLKADNFVFASDGPAAELKLIDFGLASRCGSGERLAGRAGTVDYSSPEALKEGFGLPADVWALGAIFFLIITGEPLIKVESPARTPSEELRRMLEEQTARKVLDARYIRSRLAAAAPRLSDEAVDLLEDMLRPSPDMRVTVEQALQHPFILQHSSKTE